MRVFFLAFEDAHVRFRWSYQHINSDRSKLNYIYLAMSDIPGQVHITGSIQLFISKRPEAIKTYRPTTSNGKKINKWLHARVRIIMFAIVSCRWYHVYVRLSYTKNGISLHQKVVLFCSFSWIQLWLQLCVYSAHWYVTLILSPAVDDSSKYPYSGRRERTARSVPVVVLRCTHSRVGKALQRYLLLDRPSNLKNDFLFNTENLIIVTSCGVSAGDELIA